MIVGIAVRRVWWCNRCGATSPFEETMTVGELQEWGRDHDDARSTIAGGCVAKSSELSSGGVVRLRVSCGEHSSGDTVWARWPTGRVTSRR